MSFIDKIANGLTIRPAQNINKNNQQRVSLETPQDSYYFSKTRKGDIEKGSPLNKYKPNPYYQIQYDSMGNYWNSINSKTDSHISPWKLHVFSNNKEDYHKLLSTIGPYLVEKDVSWKTIANDNVFNNLRDIQQGKAFTIYPSSNEQMADVARDIDYIVRNNNLELPKTNIIGDRQMGNTGRIFYRYQYKSGVMKNVFFDMADGRQVERMHENYDSNRGQGKYLADDMSFRDDIWFNFDPSHRPTPAEKALKLGRYTLETCQVKDGKFQLLKDVLYPIKGDEKVFLSDFEVDLSSPRIKSELKALLNGETYSIGRDESCNLPISANESKVSRQHANIYRLNNQLYIHDTSLNGTSVKRRTFNGINGLPIKNVEGCPKNGSAFVLDKNAVYPLKDISVISLPDTDISMNNVFVRRTLANLQDGDSIQIGREEDCEIRLDSSLSKVSRHHAKIYKEEGEFFIQDTSSNGTGLIKRNS